jgi:hypothetical protein
METKLKGKLLRGRKTQPIKQSESLETDLGSPGTRLKLICPLTRNKTLHPFKLLIS